MKLLSVIKKLVRRFYQLHPAYHQQRMAIDSLSILVAKGLIKEIKSRGVYKSFEKCEFKVFSQFGDEGLSNILFTKLETYLIGLSNLE